MSEQVNGRDDERLADDAERELAWLIAVDPSPEFAARVRVRIEQQPARVFAWRPWLLVSAAAAAVIVVALVMARRETSAPTPAAPVQADRWLPPQSHPAPQPAVRATRTNIHIVPPRVDRLTPAEPQVLIDPALARAVRRLAMERPVLPQVPPEPSLDPVVLEPLHVPDVSEFGSVRLQADEGRR